MDEKKISSERLLLDCKDPDEDHGVVIMLEGEESKLQFTEISSEDLVRFCFINFSCEMSSSGVYSTMQCNVWFEYI